MGISKEERIKRDKLFELGLKICSRCHNVKTIGSFGKDSAAKDGLSYACKLCRSTLTNKTKELSAERINLFSQKKKRCSKCKKIKGHSDFF